jgi:glutamine synthetase
MLNNIRSLHLNETIIRATYVWIGHSGELRSKSKTFELPKNVSAQDFQFPHWDYDGSSTNQAIGCNSEVILHPVRVFPDPFRKNAFLVMCDIWDYTGNPHPDNNRYHASQIFNEYKHEKPWFGLEQEFFLFKRGTHTPSGLVWNKDTKLPPQGQYYCSVGASNCFDRQLMEDFYAACLFSGIKISGINAEVAPSQWEYQIGPCEGIEQGDHLWMSRYILLRIAELYNYDIDFSPKPILGDINGSGCHVNFSTLEMRSENGLEHILSAIQKLKEHHKELISSYGGEDNKQRLTGKHETAKWDTFSWGYSDRGSTVRIGRKTQQDKKGYMEIRAVASNCDPYKTTSAIFETAIKYKNEI